MATATITPDQEAVQAEVFIAAPPERVFQAITDPSQALKWWGQVGLYRTTEWHADLRPGGKWKCVGLSADGSSYTVEGEYLEVDPPRLLVHTWNKSWKFQFTTIVRWELYPQEVHGLQAGGSRKTGTGTLLRVHHTGFGGHPKEAADHGQGWKKVLGWVQAYAETGETIDSRPPVSAV